MILRFSPVFLLRASSSTLSQDTRPSLHRLSIENSYVLLENISFNVTNKKVPPTLPIQFLEVYDGKRFYYSKNIGSRLNLGDELINLNTKEKSKIKKIYNSFESVDQIKKSNLVFELNNEISVVGGDVLSKSEHLPHTDSLKARIFCTSKNGIIPQ